MLPVACPALSKVEQKRRRHRGVAQMLNHQSYMVLDGLDKSDEVHVHQWSVRHNMERINVPTTTLRQRLYTARGVADPCENDLSTAPDSGHMYIAERDGGGKA